MNNSNRDKIVEAVFVLEKILLDCLAVGEIQNLLKSIVAKVRHENGDTVYGIIAIRITNVPVSLRISSSSFLIGAGKILSAISDGNMDDAVVQLKHFVANIYIDSLPSSDQGRVIAEIILPDGNNDGIEDYVKSRLSNASTLLNAGKTTNFLYRVTGAKLDNDAIGAINAVSGQRDRMKMLKEFGCGLEYAATDNKTFESNLMLVDTSMPKIAACCLVEFFMDGISSVKSVTERIAAENPLGLNIDNLGTFYEHKMKTLLVDVALGMTPAKLWTGRYDANGGYIVVRGDGDVVCYHFYLRNEIESYLYNNTRFESASRSRYDYGSLFRGEDGSVYIRLNMQIRFD